MRSCIIYSDFENLPALYVVDEDWSRFDGTCMNSGDELAGELTERWCWPNGTRRYEVAPTEEWVDALRQGAVLIRIGMIP